MTHIGLVDTVNGNNKNLEESLGISTVVNGNVPPSFSPTVKRGAIAISPGPLPTNPTTGTIAIDINDNNTLKWWNGSDWMIAGA